MTAVVSTHQGSKEVSTGFFCFFYLIPLAAFFFFWTTLLCWCLSATDSYKKNYVVLLLDKKWLFLLNSYGVAWNCMRTFDFVQPLYYIHRKSNNAIFLYIGLYKNPVPIYEVTILYNIGMHFLSSDRKLYP